MNACLSSINYFSVIARSSIIQHIYLPYLRRRGKQTHSGTCRHARSEANIARHNRWRGCDDCHAESKSGGSIAGHSQAIAAFSKGRLEQD
jgi:hypothetical protein